MKKILATSILLTLFVTGTMGCGHMAKHCDHAQKPAGCECGGDKAKDGKGCTGACVHDKKDSKKAECEDCKKGS